MPVLVVTDGPQAGERIEVESELVLGREGADFVIEDHELSRRHARFRVTDGAVEVDDLDSLNGTWVNGARISKPARLEPGDAVRLGLTVLEVEQDAPRAAETVVAPGAVGGSKSETVVRPAQPVGGGVPDTGPGAERGRFDRSMLRVGGAAAVLGTSAFIPAQALHPLPEADVEGSFLVEITAAAGYWTFIHLLALLAYALGFVTMIGIYQWVQGPTAKTLATIGLAFGAIGTAFTVSWTAIDGVAINQIAENWATAPPAQKETEFRVASAIEEIILAYFSLSWTVWFGLPFALLAAAIAASGRRRVRLLGQVGVIAAAAAFVAGLVQTYTGRDFVVTDIVFPITGILVGVWILVIGIVLWREGSAIPAGGRVERDPAR